MCRVSWPPWQGLLPGFSSSDCSPWAPVGLGIVEFSARWRLGSTALIWSVALALTWPLLRVSLDSPWVVDHPMQATLIGMSWSLFAVLWVATFYAGLRQPGPVWLRTVGEASLLGGVIIQFIASTLVIGAARMWPPHTREHVVEWYLWLSLGYAMSLLVLGALISCGLSCRAEVGAARMLLGGGLFVVSVTAFFFGQPVILLLSVIMHLLCVVGIARLALFPGKMVAA